MGEKNKGRIPIVSIVDADEAVEGEGDEAEDKEILPTNSMDPARSHRAKSHDLAKIKKLKNRLLPFAFADSAENSQGVFGIFHRAIE